MTNFLCDISDECSMTNLLQRISYEFSIVLRIFYDEESTMTRRISYDTTNLLPYDESPMRNVWRRQGGVSQRHEAGSRRQRQRQASAHHAQANRYMSIRVLNRYTIVNFLCSTLIH